MNGTHSDAVQKFRLRKGIDVVLQQDRQPEFFREDLPDFGLFLPDAERAHGYGILPVDESGDPDRDAADRFLFFFRKIYSSALKL